MVDVIDQDDILHQLYVIDSDEAVSTAKSDFAERYDVPYHELNGSIIHNSGDGWSGAYKRAAGKRLCVVVHDE
jgi:hypothetical protein